jgi:stage II sporulation protein D
MFTRILFILLSTLSIVSSAQAGMWENFRDSFWKRPQSPKIKVLIVHDSEGIVLEVKGKYNIYDPYQKSLLAARFSGKGNYIQPLLRGLKWGEEFPGIYQILIVPDAPQITTVVDGIEYRGLMYVYDIGGKISVVNEVDIEDYLSSVLALQLKGPLSEEAMAALAIIERTNALYQSTSRSNPFWHVKAQEVGYEGHAVTGRISGIDSALASTRYMVMSRSSSGSSSLAPFPTNLENKKDSALANAEAMASKGSNAAEILSKMFPNTSIQMASQNSRISYGSEVSEKSPKVNKGIK